jgi:O-antigen ligase
MTLLRLACIVYFFILPFQFALSPGEGVDLASIRLVTMALVFSWIIHGFLFRRMIFPSLLATLFLSGFTLLALGSALWAENSLFALRKSLFFLSFLPLFFVLAALFFDQPSWRGVILKSFALGAALSALVGIIIFFSQFLFGLEYVLAFLLIDILPFFLGPAFAQSVATHPSLLVNVSGATLLRASGVFPDPHMFSLYLGLAAPLALGFSLDSLQTRKKRFWMSIFIILLLGILLAFSRGAYVALLSGMAVYLLASGLLQATHWRKKWPIFLGGIILCVVLALSPFGNRLFSSFSQEDGSNRERLRLWEEAVVHIAERPFFGVGLGNYPLTVKPDATYRDPIYAHNLFLDISVELGLIGLFFFLALSTLSFWQALLQWKKARQWQALSVAASLSVFFMHACFEMPLFSVHILPVFVLLLSIGVSYGYEKRLPS